MFTAVGPVEGFRTSTVSAQSSFQTETTTLFQLLLSTVCPASHLDTRPFRTQRHI